MPFDFTGKKVLVTGAGRGIGRALVKALVEAGGEVYALSVTKDNLDSLAEELPGIHPMLVDLSDWEATRQEVDKLGPLDGLVNNAAVAYPWISSLETSKEQMQKTLDVNLLAAVNLIQSVGKKMIEAGKGGSIVNVSSINGLLPMRECMAYNLAKAALDMATKQYALELGPHKIRVNSINPTVTMTDMGREHWSNPDKARVLLSHTPMGRFLEVQDVLDLLMFLLSDQSTMMTGNALPLEGGLLSNIQA